MDTLPDPRWQAALAHSQYLSTLLQARPALIPELAATWLAPLSEAQLLAALTPAAEDDAALKAQLRQLRQRAMAHIALRDLCGLAPMDREVARKKLQALAEEALLHGVVLSSLSGGCRGGA